MSPNAQAITLSAAQSVPPDAVENTLAGLWRQASEDSGQESGGNVIRACLWNLLVYNPRSEAMFKDILGHGYGLRSLLDEVLPALPARVLRLELGTDSAPSPESDYAVMARVAAKCEQRGNGKHIYGEEINLEARGSSGDSYFPSLVRALLQPSLPIALLGLDDLPQQGWVLKQLLQLCDRVLVDTQSPEYHSDLQFIHGFLDSTDAIIVDVGWLRLTPLRYLVASFFDPPGEPDHLKRIESVVVETTPAGRNSGLMLLGWLLSRCGISDCKREAPGRQRWWASKDKQRFSLELRIKEDDPRDGGVDGVLEIEIRAGGARYCVRDLDSDDVALESPHRNEARVPLHGWRDSELVIAALGAQGIDRVYVEGLRSAAHLLKEVP